MLELSLRQMRRLADYRVHGAAALAHGNRGRKQANKQHETVEMEILRLTRGAYIDDNDSHFSEELAEGHQIVVLRPTGRRVR